VKKDYSKKGGLNREQKSRDVVGNKLLVYVELILGKA